MRITFIAPLLALAIIAPQAAVAQTVTPLQQFLTDIIKTCVDAPQAITATLQSHGFKPGKPVPRSEHRSHSATFNQRQVSMAPPMQVRGLWQLCQVTVKPHFTREEAAAIIDPILTPIPVPAESHIPATYGGAWCLNSAHKITYSIVMRQGGKLHIRPNQPC